MTAPKLRPAMSPSRCRIACSAVSQPSHRSVSAQVSTSEFRHLSDENTYKSANFMAVMKQF